MIEVETLTPLNDRLIVRALEEDEISAGGVIIPDAARERPQKGEVLAVGPGPRLEDGTHVPMAIAAGDTVVCTKYGGTEVTINGEDLLILREQDVLAKVADEE